MHGSNNEVFDFILKFLIPEFDEEMWRSLYQCLNSAAVWKQEGLLLKTKQGYSRSHHKEWLQEGIKCQRYICGHYMHI